MTEDKPKITVPEGQGISDELKDVIEGGEFVEIPKEQVVSFITIAFVKQNPNPNSSPQLRYEFQNMSPMALPTLLRKVAKDIEDGILRASGVVT